MPELKTTTKTYTNDRGKEVEVTGFDISEFPAPQEHDFYQSGSYVMCTCHKGTARRIPDGMELTKEKGLYKFRKREIS